MREKGVGMKGNLEGGSTSKVSAGTSLVLRVILCLVQVLLLMVGCLDYRAFDRIYILLVHLAYVHVNMLFNHMQGSSYIQR